MLRRACWWHEISDKSNLLCFLILKWHKLCTYVLQKTPEILYVVDSNAFFRVGMICELTKQRQFKAAPKGDYLELSD